MKKDQKSMLVLGIVTAFTVAVLFLPGLVHAGDLEPANPPGATMKTLNEIPPTWSQILDASERFESVMDGYAVLDKETGLVWERTPDTDYPDTDKRDWYAACSHCYKREVANRKGWRLPTIEELASLVDNNDGKNPTLPAGHPFNVPSATYWSSTTDADDTSYAWRVYFGSGGVGVLEKSGKYYVWCVRGGPGYDAY